MRKSDVIIYKVQGDLDQNKEVKQNL